MTDKYQFIEYRKHGHVAYVTLNRPEVLNALHTPAQNECADAFADFDADADMWVAIVSGAGERAFSTGLDLRFFAAPGDQPVTRAPGGFAALTNPRECRIWKPIIAAVHGYALGGGFELAMACDIVVAADNATFGLPEVKIGNAAGGGGIHRLPRQMPLKIAMGYLLTGRHFGAVEALRWGLVNEVVPREELMAAAERWAHDIAAAAPLSVRATKEAALLGLDMPLEEAYNAQFAGLQAMRASQDSKEGVQAFVEKRPPVWTGR